MSRLSWLTIAALSWPSTHAWSHPGRPQQRAAVIARLTHQPNDVVAHLERARLAEDDNDIPALLVEMGWLAPRAVGDPDVALALGVALGHLGDRSGAESLYTLALLLEPDHLEARWQRARLHLSDACDDYVLVATHTRSPDAWADLGANCAPAGEWLLVGYQATGSEALRLQAARAFLRDGDVIRARELAVRAVRDYPRSDAWRALAEPR